MRLFWYWLKGILFPRRCILCRSFLKDHETDLCHECRQSAPSYPFGAGNPDPSGKISGQFLDSFTAVWYYEGNARASILRFKFHGAGQYAAAYGRLLAMKLCREHPEGFDMVTWVPISRRRRWTRGYDQSQLLADAVCRELGMEAIPLLRKVRNNKRQSGMPAEQRKANVLGAYSAVNREALAGKRILLLDDVFTTGSTAEECARVLLTAGAGEVHGAAVAAAQKHEK